MKSRYHIQRTMLTPLYKYTTPYVTTRSTQALTNSSTTNNNSMDASTSFTHDLVVEYSPHTRKLLLQFPLHNQLSPTSSPSIKNSTTDSYFGNSEFDSNAIMILAVILCALICSLGLNSIIRCGLRFSSIVINDYSETNNNSASPQLANKGIKKKALKKFPTVNYTAELKLPGLDTECVICLSEFTNGEKVRVLPKCNHGFHVRCIDQWLSSHSSCPKCRQCLLETQTVVGSSQVQPQPQQQQQQQLQVVLPVPEVVIRIEPLEPEGVERSYR